MLWFVVDLPYGRGYFFNYGVERTVKETRRKDLQVAAVEGRITTAELSQAPFSRAL